MKYRITIPGSGGEKIELSEGTAKRILSGLHEAGTWIHVEVYQEVEQGEKKQFVAKRGKGPIHAKKCRRLPVIQHPPDSIILEFFLQCVRGTSGRTITEFFQWMKGYDSELGSMHTKAMVKLIRYRNASIRGHLTKILKGWPYEFVSHSRGGKQKRYRLRSPVTGN